MQTFLALEQLLQMMLVPFERQMMVVHLEQQMIVVHLEQLTSLVPLKVQQQQMKMSLLHQQHKDWPSSLAVNMLVSDKTMNKMQFSCIYAIIELPCAGFSLGKDQVSVVLHS